MKSRNIKSLMIKYSFNQVTLSEYLGISLQSLNLKLNGKREFKESELISMADLFKVTVDYLLEREDYWWQS